MPLVGSLTITSISYVSLFVWLLTHDLVLAQQMLPQVFKIDANTVHNWFTADDTTRSIALSPTGNILVADRKPADAIYILNPNTGIQLGRLSMQGVEGGIYKINKVGMADDGKIYGCNLALLDNSFKIYCWDSETDEPTVVFEKMVKTRRGDTMDVVGAGTWTRILVGGSKDIDFMLISDQDGDGEFNLQIKIPKGTGIFGAQTHCWDVDASSFWARKSYISDAAPTYYFHPSGNYASHKHVALRGYAPMETFRLDHRAYIAFGPGNFPDEGGTAQGLVYTTEGVDNLSYVTASGLEPESAPLNGNLNGAGDVVFDPKTRRLYFLFTNNSISGWQIP